MKAVVTTEKRPAYQFISGIWNELVGTTHKYQNGIEVIVVFSVKVPVVFVRLFSELFVEACSRIWLRFCESRFDRGGQVIARSVYSVRSVEKNNVGAQVTPLSLIFIRLQALHLSIIRRDRLLTRFQR